MSTEPQPESPESPYGPADSEPTDLDRAFGEQTVQSEAAVQPESVKREVETADAAAAAVAEPAWVTRGRHLLRWAALATGGLSLVVLAVVLVVSALGESVLSSAQSEIGYGLVWFATLASPVLAVIALNLLIWRALLRPIARKGRTEAAVLISLTALGLAIASVGVVFVLLLGGFFLVAVLA